MNRRENIKTPHYYRDKISVASLRFIFLFFLFVNISFAQTNKEEYDINDPRNPNCPCHKQQQQADEEYAQINKKNKNSDGMKQKEGDNIVVKEKINDGVDFNLDKGDKNSAIEKNTNQKKYISSGNSKRKRKNMWYKKTKFHLYNKYKKEIKFTRIFDKCFEW